MTFKDKLMQEHPDMLNRCGDVRMGVCMYNLGYENVRFCNNNGIYCKHCWEREIPIYNSPIDYIKNNVTLENRLMMLAEESAELSQAALKLIRSMGYGNPTPVSVKDAASKLLEEATDVILCLHVLSNSVDTFSEPIYNEKANRWVHRLKEEAAK